MRARVRFGLACAIVIASITAPLLTRWRTQANLRATAQPLQQQTASIALLGAEHERLSSLLAQANSAQSRSQSQQDELLRLRGEAARLRGATNELEQLRETNRQLSGWVEEELWTETREAMKKICRELPGALQRYANDHTNQAPNDFSDIRKYFPASEGLMAGLHSFEFVSETEVADSGEAVCLTPRDGVVLTANGESHKPGGKSARLYGFLDGRVIEVVLDNSNDYIAWEKQNLNLSPSGRQ